MRFSTRRKPEGTKEGMEARALLIGSSLSKELPVTTSFLSRFWFVGAVVVPVLVVAAATQG
jgi:hypothetical protein